MPRGGRRSTTWGAEWKSGKTTVIRVPESLVEELLRLARILDEGGALSVTGKNEIDAASLKEAADTFLMTCLLYTSPSPRDRG
jgi:hypothetical protein